MKSISREKQSQIWGKLKSKLKAMNLPSIQSTSSNFIINLFDKHGEDVDSTESDRLEHVVIDTNQKQRRRDLNNVIIKSKYALYLLSMIMQSKRDVILPVLSILWFNI